MRYTSTQNGHEITTIFKTVRTELMPIKGGTLCLFHDASGMSHIMATSLPKERVVEVIERGRICADLTGPEFGMVFIETWPNDGTFHAIKNAGPGTVTSAEQRMLDILQGNG